MIASVNCPACLSPPPTEAAGSDAPSRMELIKFAFSVGYNQVRLSSNKVLQASHRLYESMGFQPISPWDLVGETHSRYFVLRIK